MLLGGRRSLAALAALGALGGADGAAQIATATDIDLCLHGSPGKALKLVDCLESPTSNDQWDAWGWDPSKATPVTGPLCSTPGPNGTACVGSDLVMGAANDDAWSWSDRTMKIQQGGKCLTVLRHGGTAAPRVDLKECNWTVGIEQNKGGPSNQAWILLPEKRSQLDILPELKLPLRASGRHFVDTTGRPVRLVGINWYGAHMEQLVNNGLDRTTVKKIAARILRMGFNSVRLNYALNITDNSTGSFPAVPDPKLVAGDPSLDGLNVLEVFDKCVKALTDLGLLVILNVHMSDAGWCCNLDDGNALWYNDAYSEEFWVRSLEFLAARYKGNQRVVGFDIRNEPRTDARHKDTAYWGVWEPGAWLTSPLFHLRDWRVAAAKGAVATWKGDPDALVIVEGINFAMHLKYVESRAMKLSQKCLFSRVAYENHDYAFFNFGVWDWVEYPWAWWTIYQDVKGHGTDEFKGESDGASGALTESMQRGYSREYKRFKDSRVTSFLFLHTEDRAPVWTGEFGTADRNSSFWQNVIHLYKDVDYSWCYWPLDAVSVLPGISRRVIEGTDFWEGRLDHYGLFDSALPDYKAVVGWKLQDLISIQGTRPEFPSLLPAPEKCEFVAELNEEYASEGTSLGEMLSTTNWPLWLLLWALITALCCGGCCAVGCCCVGVSNLARGNNKSSESEEPLNGPSSSRSEEPPNDPNSSP